MRWLLLLLPTGCFSIPKENLEDWPCLVRGECGDETGQPRPDDSDSGQPDSAHTGESGADTDTGDPPHTGDSTPGGDTATSTRYYRDGDADGYGDPEVYVDASTRPGAWVTDGTDCDDDDATRYPGAPEVCEDGKDNDCDDSTDPDADCRMEGEHTDEDADWTLLGEGYYDQAGYAVAGAGDIDGDGVPDLLVGAVFYSYKECGGTGLSGGAIHVWSGGSGTGGELSDSSVLIKDPWTCTGTSSFTYLTAYGVGSMGDLDTDGLADVFFRYEYYSSYIGIVPGATLLGAAETAGAELSTADPDIIRLNTGGYATPLDDMDGDAVPDLGACNLSTDKVAVYSGAEVVEDGSSATAIWRAQTSSGFGVTYPGISYPPFCLIAAVPDISGTGANGMIVGVSWEDPGGKADAGIAYVLDELPDADGTLAGQAYAISDTDAGSYLGSLGVASVGDINGDGYPDLGISSYSSGSVEELYIFFGPVEYSRSIGSADVLVSDAFAPASPNVGDVDGDGRDDLLATSWTNGGVLRHGPLAAGTYDDAPDATFSDYSGTLFGVAAAGDVDLDGQADILVGDISDSSSGTNSGAAYLYTGSAF